MKLAWLFSGLFLTGCMANNGLGSLGSADANIGNLARISKGMSETEVLCIMHKPYNYETFYINQDIYDVWFYVTRPTTLGQSRMVPLNLTPLTFKNGQLISWGYDYYNYLVKQEAILAREQKSLPQTAPIENGMSPEENKDLEEILQSHPQTETSESSSQELPIADSEKINSEEDEEMDEEEGEPSPEKEKPRWTEEDQRMQEDESEQDFNFW
ncbi:MAG: DUF3192 domain-containing protein [Chlamydiota bacterium]